VLLSAINIALDEVKPEAVNFGTLMAEQASAARLMMTVAQMVKHIDAASPVRFLIAETETGYTLLTALYFAKLFGIEDRIEISPLFETAEALSQGGRIIEEALRSPHYRAYLRKTGKLCVQFGYSDSGRYVGQIAATYLIERLRLKLCEAMVKHGLRDVEIVLFDTHGESIGRGAHPGSLQDRLAYLSPAAGRRAFDTAGIAYREESAFQGGDGYLLFGTPALASAVILRIAEFALAKTEEGDDPIYQDPDFAADFFATIRSSMEELVEDPGYAAMLGTFGPALIDRTGSRPAARQSDSSGGPALISHPRELRAIPNNAILQQLGWCANTLQGVGTAAHQPALPARDGFRLPCAAAFASRRAARGRGDAGPRHLAGPRRAQPHSRPARGADRSRHRARAAGHLVGGAGHVPARPCRPFGAAGGLAGCTGSGS
jgi:phosphoenolpyruvate carboxylase